MRGYLKSFLLLFILCCTGSALAAEVGANESCGGTSGNTCKSGFYCNTTPGVNKCAKCDDDYPLSAPGSTKRTDCYQKCNNISVTLGTLTSDRDKVHYNTNNETCTYTLQCIENAEQNGTDNTCKCKEHYTGTTACTGECYVITLKKNLTNFMESDKHLYVKYDNGFYTNNACSGTQLNSSSTWPTPSYNWWQTFTGYSTEQNGGAYRFGPNGQPTNGTTNTTFTGNTTLYGQWNKSKYTVNYFDASGTTQIGDAQTCTITSEPNDTTIKGNCQARETSISYDNGNTIIGWSTTKNSKTPAYNFGDNIGPDASSQTITLYAALGPCPAGYYCNATAGRNPCPAGATSAAGASEIGDCYISSATQFSDKNGSFTLPIGNINYQ